ncbi:MAG: hypothetical protein ACOX5Z_09445 [Desulfobulbus sp.]|jgi:hypothetical protein
MKIAATTISMDAAHSHTEVEVQTSGWRPGPDASGAAGDPFGVRLSSLLTAEQTTRYACRSSAAPPCSGQEPVPPPSPPPQKTSPPSPDAGATPWRTVATAALNSPDTAWGSLTSAVHRVEEEQQWFSAVGGVRTEDGREIDFSMDWSMERRREQCVSASLPMLSLFIDPLLLQFDPSAPLLDDSALFDFDLDGDGVADTLACPGSGSGFLALDLDGDGRITSGRELFGPVSGSGFGELAELDDDENGWIDENDPFFDRLLLWTPDGQGGESLRGLREAGVGAISVLNLGAAFQLERNDGTVLGRIKASGLFLTEAGEVRPLHEVDLALPASEGATEHPVLAGGGAQAMDRLRAIIEVQRQQLELLVNGRPGRIRRIVSGNRKEQRDQLLQMLVRRREKHRDALFGWLEQRAQWSRATEAVSSEHAATDIRGIGNRSRAVDVAGNSRREDDRGRKPAWPV